MKGFEHILVATDFSEPAGRALELACRLSKEFDAHITLVHVNWLPVSAYAAYVAGAAAPESDVTREAVSRMGAAIERASRLGAKVEPLLSSGEAWEKILSVAEERGADLIVMGTHARKGVSRLLLGSVAEKVVRLSPVPVLTTASATSDQGRAEEGPIPLREIVVATDFSRPARLALDLAIELARRVGGRVTLLHSYFIPQIDYGMVPYYPTAEVEAAAQKALDEEVARAKTQYANVEGLLAFGDAAEQVFQLVRQRAANMVVIGTHGKRWASRVLLGSVADRVLRGCGVPVLTVPDLAPKA